MSEIIIPLPLPDAKLSANARVHWTVRSRLTKEHRAAAYFIACSLKSESIKLISYRLIFTWPDKRRRDRDNAAARCKAYLDGIADAFGQDDSEWEFDGVRFNDADKLNPHVDVVFQIEDLFALRTQAKESE